MKITVDSSGTLTIFRPQLDANGKPATNEAGAPLGTSLSIAPSQIKAHMRDPELRKLLSAEQHRKALAGEEFTAELPDAAV